MQKTVSSAVATMLHRRICVLPLFGTSVFFMSVCLQFPSLQAVESVVIRVCKREI